MKPRIILFTLFFFVFSSCAVHHKNISHVQDWSYPQVQFDDQFSFGYVDHLLEKTNNKKGSRWARRKNIHVIGIRLVNNTDKPIHGSQVMFMNNGERVEIIHNKWLAKKVRQRFSPLMILWLPVLAIEAALFPPEEDHEGFTVDEPNYISKQAMREENKKRIKANFDLHQELMDFQLASKILLPGEIVNGVIGVKCKSDPGDLRAVVKPASFDVVLVEE